MHTCYNSCGARIVEINNDGSGVIEGNLTGNKQYPFTPDILFGNRDKLKLNTGVSFTLNLKNQVVCVHL